MSKGLVGATIRASFTAVATGAAVLLVSAAPQALVAQPRSVLIAPVASPAAENLASELTDRLRAGVNSFGSVDLRDLEALLDTHPLSRELDADRRDDLGCIHARQLAASEEVDEVVCGTLTPTEEGLLLELHLHGVGSGRTVQARPLVSSDREVLYRHALAEVAGWFREELPPPGALQVAPSGSRMTERTHSTSSWTPSLRSSTRPGHPVQGGPTVGARPVSASAARGLRAGGPHDGGGSGHG